VFSWQTNRKKLVMENSYEELFANCKGRRDKRTALYVACPLIPAADGRNS